MPPSLHLTLSIDSPPKPRIWNPLAKNFTTNPPHSSTLRPLDASATHGQHTPAKTPKIFPMYFSWLFLRPQRLPVFRPPSLQTYQFSPRSLPRTRIPNGQTKTHSSNTPNLHHPQPLSPLFTPTFYPPPTNHHIHPFTQPVLHLNTETLSSSNRYPHPIPTPSPTSHHLPHPSTTSNPPFTRTAPQYIIISTVNSRPTIPSSPTNRAHHLPPPTHPTSFHSSYDHPLQT